MELQTRYTRFTEAKAFWRSIELESRNNGVAEGGSGGAVWVSGLEPTVAERRKVNNTFHLFPSIHIVEKVGLK